jgi:hypothetical protein
MVAAEVSPQNLTVMNRIPLSARRWSLVTLLAVASLTHPAGGLRSPWLASGLAAESAPGLAATTDDELLRTRIKAGLEVFNTFKLPIGKIRVDFRNGDDYAAKDFSPQIGNHLQRMRQLGLVTYERENPNSPPPTGAFFMIVTLTDKARKAADPQLSTEEYAVVRIATVDAKIESKAAYQSPRLPPGRYLLVQGTYDTHPNELFLAGEPTAPVKHFRFRAVVEEIPGARRYELKAVDYGEIGSTEWKTNNVP